MKTNWQTKKLSEVCDIGAGNSAPQKKEFFVDGKYPLFRTSDIGQIHIGRITESSDYLNEKGIKGLKLFNKGTILLPKSGASTFLNHRVVLGIDGYVSSHLATVKTDEKVLNNKYLFYFLQEVKAQDLIQDHKYPSLNLPVIGNIEISYPESLPKQHRIVKILDEVFADIAKAKENAEKNLQNAKELFESYLQNVFANPGKDWEEKRLSDICKIGDGNHSSNYPKKNEMVVSGVPFIRGVNLINGSISDIDMRFISKEKHNKLKKGHLESGDILFTNRGEIGKMAIVDQAHHGSNLNSQIAWFRCKNEIFNEFLYYQLLSPGLQSFFMGSKSGTALQQFTIKQISNVIIKFPSLSEQKAIVKKLNVLSAETKKLGKIYEQKLADLEELKKSVLNKAFRGEL